MNILTTTNLCKKYGANLAVDNVNMTVNQGDIYGFVGLNGAGKTTVIRLITGLINKTSGSFDLFGMPDSGNLCNERRKISSMVETPALYLNMTSVDNMKIQCAIMQMPIVGISDLLKLVGLDSTSRVLAKNFSLGMRQRLGIAMALVGDPKFMLLDEPTNGLDPEGIIEIRDLLLSLNKTKGITILISSHILSELSKLATTYGFIHKGKLIKQISADGIFADCGKTLVLDVDNVSAAYAALKVKHTPAIKENKIYLAEEVSISELSHTLEAVNVTLNGINTVSRDLEHYFIDLISSTI